MAAVRGLGWLPDYAKTLSVWLKNHYIQSMANIDEYLKWRGDLVLCDETFSPIDMLIFSELVYTPLENIDPSCYGKKLSELQPLVYPEGLVNPTSFMDEELFYLWTQIIDYRRFADVRLVNFVSKFDVSNQMQFAAATFVFGKMMFIAFRGTDASIIGWKEDLNMGYETPIPSQTEAVAYIDSVSVRNKDIYLCGHSKGGNLAMYGGAFCKKPKRIKAIYSFDGPGFDDDVLASKKWMATMGKVSSYIPESSIIGMILSHSCEYTIVKSDNVGIKQHDPFNWHIEAGKFEEVADTSFTSKLFRETMRKFLVTCPTEQRRVLVETVFKIIEASGATITNDILPGLFKHLGDVRRILQEVPEKDKQALSQMGRIFADAGSTSFRLLMSKL